MKTLKPVAVILAAALIVSLTIGANSGNDERPADVPAERWLPVGPNAGFVLSVDVAGPIPTRPPAPISLHPNDLVAAAFYVKTRIGWRRARIESPAHIVPLSK